MSSMEQMQHIVINGRECILFRKGSFQSVLKLERVIHQEDVPEIHRLFLVEYNKMNENG